MAPIPVHVTFRGLPHSNALETEIREHVASLERLGGLMECRVLVEIPHRHRHSGSPFHVHVELAVPGGGPIIVSHAPSLHAPLKDMHARVHRKATDIEGAQQYARVAVRQAFDVAHRRLEDHVQQRRDAVAARGRDG